MTIGVLASTALVLATVFGPVEAQAKPGGSGGNAGHASAGKHDRSGDEHRGNADQANAGKRDRDRDEHGTKAEHGPAKPAKGEARETKPERPEDRVADTIARQLTGPHLGEHALVAGGTPRLPTFNPRDFRPGQPINNPRFPLREGTIYRYAGKERDDSGTFVPSPDVIRATHRTKRIDGVDALATLDTVFSAGKKSEVTTDYYAQDRKGNVWYLGEDTTAFEFNDRGKVVDVSHEGSWRAGVNGAKPGIIMPARPRLGTELYQEFRPGVALDAARIVATDATLVDHGTTYRHVLVTRETTALEPGVLDFKFYAPGVGFVRELEFDPEGRLSAESHFTRVTPSGAAASAD